MTAFNYDAFFTVNEKKYFLTEEEIRLSGVTEIKWPNRNHPPLVVSTKIIEAIENKYGSELINNQKKILGARIVNILYSDFINLLRIGQINAKEGAYSIDSKYKEEMERERLDIQARSSKTIPREEFEEYYKQKNGKLYS